MPRKFAIKRLTLSDLTLFESHFRRGQAGNQKAINLNADIFVDVHYPILPALSMAAQSRIPIDLYVYGPGLSGELNFQRKVIKGNTYKNWRLDGEFIYAPDDSPTRFDTLNEGDYVIFEFLGDSIPSTVRAVFVARAMTDDQALHESIAGFVNGQRMIAISESQLAGLVETASPVAEHPVNELMLGSGDLEDAVHLGYNGTSRLLARPRGQRMSTNQFRQARIAAEETGLRGEELVNAFLSNEQTVGNLTSYEWESAENAISPYDFSFVEIDGTDVLLDVKSTTGEFTRTIHMSLNELMAMADNTHRYDLYRIYGLDGSAATMRIPRDTREFAESIIRALADLPEGVHVDSISVSPTNLDFGPALDVLIPNEPEE